MTYSHRKEFLLFTLIQSFDETIQFFIQNHFHIPILDTLFIFITKLGDSGLIWIALGLVLCFFQKTRKCGIAVLLSLLVEWGICDGILKNVIARPRPYTMYPDITLYVPQLHSYSFPSGHSASSFTAAVALFLFYKRPGIAAITLAALIAFSRVYLFMHWVTDVLGGALLGTLVAICVVTLLRAIENRYLHKNN